MRALRVVAPAVLVVVAFCALLLALAFGGGADAPLLADPGASVRYGLPVAKLLVNLSAAGMIGSLVLTVFALSGARAELNAALDVAAASAAVMTVASAATGFLTYMSVAGIPLSSSREFSDGLNSFVTSVSLGQAWLWTTLMSATVTVLCFAVRNQTALLFVTAFALLTLLPMAQQGHAAGTSGHDAAVTALGLHLAFAAIWLGGLLTLVLVHRTLEGGRLVVVIERYSTLAIVCFVVVAASGYVSAELRIGTLPELLTPYGVLVLVKAAALMSIGLFGMLQRRWLIDRLRSVGGRGVFWWIVTAELAFMGIASGVAAALARTATPVEQALGAAPTPAEILTGEPLPPALTPLRLLTVWNVDLLWLLGCAFGIFFYLAAVRRLRGRGDRWPVGRTIAWIVGMLLLFSTASGGVAVYEKYLFSAHMTVHLVLAMVVPLLLVPGAPATLALRAIRTRTDATRGPREWLLLIVRSRLARVLVNPIVATALFVVSPWIFFFSPLFRWATSDQFGHEWMIVYFLVTGCLFVRALIGGEYRAFSRLVLLAIAAASHAAFGLLIMNTSGLYLADWFGAMGRTWGLGALADQRLGGAIALVVSGIPTVVIAIVVAVQGSRARGPSVADREVERAVGANVDGGQ